MDFLSRAGAQIILSAIRTEQGLGQAATSTHVALGATLFRREALVSADWKTTFAARVNGFQERHRPRRGEMIVSMKVRVLSGCFHREHSPRAYAAIDQHLEKLLGPDAGVAFEEHESGPELLVYIALGTAGITLAKSVIDLITAVIKARSEGIARGDVPSSPVELVVRRISEHDELREELVLRFSHGDPVSRDEIATCLHQALERMFTKDSPVQPGCRSSRNERNRKRARH